MTPDQTAAFKFWKAFRVHHQVKCDKVWERHAKEVLKKYPEIALTILRTLDYGRNMYAPDSVKWWDVVNSRHEERLKKNTYDDETFRAIMGIQAETAQ